MPPYDDNISNIWEESQHSSLWIDTLTPYTYYATITKVYGGDTFTADLNLGLDTWRHRLNVRLNGCNSIELKEPGGKEAQANLASILPVGTVVLLQSVKYDRYGGLIDAQV